MSDADATQVRQDVVAEIDEIIEHVINANMLNMPYDVYSELFDAVDGLGVEIENIQAENAKLRELCGDMMWTIRHAHGYFKNDTHEMLMTYVRGRDGKPTHVAHSLTCDEEEYERRMRELGVIE